MARDPGEWYAEKAAQAERLDHELRGARAVLEALRAASERGATDAQLMQVARAVIQRLERALECARFVGD